MTLKEYRATSVPEKFYPANSFASKGLAVKAKSVNLGTIKTVDIICTYDVHLMHEDKRDNSR